MTTEVSIEDVCGACQYGDLEQLQKWKAAKQIPELCRSKFGWFPLERAARYGQLDVIKWLLRESGQAVDATTTDNLAVRVAALDGHLEVLKWLVNESAQAVDVTAADNYAIRSAAQHNKTGVVLWLLRDSGQLLRMLRVSTDWLLELKAAELRYVAVYGYGLDPAAFKDKRSLFYELRQRTPLSDASTALQTLLDQLCITKPSVRKHYMLSPVCRQAAASGLVSSLDELKQFFASAYSVSVTRPKRSTKL